MSALLAAHQGANDTEFESAIVECMEIMRSRFKGVGARDRFAVLLDDLPGLAWKMTPSRVSGVTAASRSVLLVGAWPQRSGLTRCAASGSTEILCVSEVQGALDQVQRLVPDLILIEGALQWAARLVSAIHDDSVLEPVPILIVGDPAHDDLERFRPLGAASVVATPIDDEAGLQEGETAGRA